MRYELWNIYSLEIELLIKSYFKQLKCLNLQDLRLTNCLWLTNSCRTQQQAFSVVIVVKVLAECLQTVPFDRNGHMVNSNREMKIKPSNCNKHLYYLQHAWDCSCFCLTQGNSFSVAYVVNISFNPVSYKYNTIISRIRLEGNFMSL